MGLLRVNRLGLPAFNNLQIQEALIMAHTGRSNYQALVATLRKRTLKGLTFDFNYTFSKTTDWALAAQGSGRVTSNSFFPEIDAGAASFDRTHIMNGLFIYDLPAGKGHLLSSRNWLDKVLGGWDVSGIVSAYSGLPLIAVETNQVFGGGQIFPGAVGAIPTIDPRSFGNTVHSGITGSGGIGTAGDPATKGTGLNLFENPAAVYGSFRKVLLSKDNSTGRANPLRGLPFWNFDMSLGKRTTVTERVSSKFVVTFFNLFNHVNFADPLLDLRQPASFGVIGQQLVPSNRAAGSRWIQLELRVDF